MYFYAGIDTFMRFHRPLFQATVNALYRILFEGMQADKVLEQTLKNERFGSRDRRFIAENIYGMVRWWRLVREAADPDKGEDLFYLLGVRMVIKGEELPDWDEFSSMDKDFILHRYEEAKRIRKVRESI